MKSINNSSSDVARLQNRLSKWSPNDDERLTLEQVAAKSGCSARRIRRLIELGLLLRAKKVGARAAYSARHVQQARAVQRLLAEGQYTLAELACFHNSDSFLTLELAEGLGPKEFLLSLFRAEVIDGIGEDQSICAPKLTPFEKRMLTSIASAFQSTVIAERTLINEARDALRTAAKLSR